MCNGKENLLFIRQKKDLLYYKITNHITKLYYNLYNKHITAYSAIYRAVHIEAALMNQYNEFSMVKFAKLIYLRSLRRKASMMDGLC